eukprot:gene1803-1929_t
MKLPNQRVHVLNLWKRRISSSQGVLQEGKQGNFLIPRSWNFQRKDGLIESTSRAMCSNCNHPHLGHSHTQHHLHQQEAWFSQTKLPFTQMIDHIADLLPHQGILENFVHHNPLEHFETMTFQEALDYIEKLEAYRSPGERVHSLIQINPRERVKEALVDLSASFLDRGAAKWIPKDRNKGFLYFFANLEGLGFATWREHARDTAKRILQELQTNNGNNQIVSEKIIKENLMYFGIPEEDHEACIRSMLLEIRGWAGMFRRMETHPNEAPDRTKVQLLDFAAVQSILARSSIDNLAKECGWDDRQMSLGEWLQSEPTLRPHTKQERPHSSAIAYVDQVAENREKLEKEFEKNLLSSIGTKTIPKEKVERPLLQLYTCIDDRECSLRRYIESAKPDNSIETFGLAGFFGVPIRYEPSDGRDPMILAPEGQNPSTVLIEAESPAEIEQSNKLHKRQKILAWMNLMFEKASFSPIGSLLLTSLFPLSLSRLIAMGFFPSLKYDFKTTFQKKVLPKVKTDFQLPMPAEQAASLLAKSFKDIGTQNRYGKIVMILGHGSFSMNNPFAAAYNCGACGGREGGPNARLFARLANNQEVRECLKSFHQITIPNDTLFIGAMHNTTAETIEYFDIEYLPNSHQETFKEIQQIIDKARGLNALERCQRFLLANHIKTPEEALRHVQLRAHDLAEVRPELNHATNAAVVLGRRDLTRGKFLDRRAFLPSYDPYSDDDEGTNLEHVLAPALVVCSGINLEYLFSTIDVDHHGAGTKVPLNIVGNIAVLQGTTGDLRPGLPTQMTEMHTPIRALYIVDAPPKRIEAVLARRESLRHLVRNEWVRLIARDPETNQFYRQVNGEYIPITLQDIDNTNQQQALTTTITKQLDHAHNVTKREDLIYRTALGGMIASGVIPLYMFGIENMLNPHGLMAVVGGTSLGLPILAFARRYLHGEFMFGRFAALTVGLMSGFNIVASASNLEQILAGWSLLGFSSTFLIGAYNDRPTVRNNATFIFGAYQISDLALLSAAAYSMTAGAHNPEIAAAALIVASIYKSSQLPLTALFARSMEGPTPASALGYAGLSAHSGVILLTSTMPLWFGFDWARMALGGIGLLTAMDATLVSKIRSERKGAIANATSATIGLIYGVLALGHPDLAMIMSLGHAGFRMTQVLRAPNVIQDMAKVKSALGASAVAPKEVPDWLYKLAWSLRRVDIDFTLLWLLHKISRPLTMPKDWKLNKFQQWAMTGVGVTVAGFPFTPYYYAMEHTFMDLLPTHPLATTALMAGYFGISMAVIRFLFLNVLDKNRFNNIHQQLYGPNKFRDEIHRAREGKPPKSI